MVDAQKGYGRINSEELVRLYQELLISGGNLTERISIVAIVASRAFQEGDTKRVIQVLEPEAKIIAAADIPFDSQLVLLGMLSEAYLNEERILDASRFAREVVEMTEGDQTDEGSRFARWSAFSVLGKAARSLGQSASAIQFYLDAAQEMGEAPFVIPIESSGSVHLPLAELFSEAGEVRKMLEMYEECDRHIELRGYGAAGLLFKIRKETSKAFYASSAGASVEAAEAAAAVWNIWFDAAGAVGVEGYVSELIEAFETLALYYTGVPDYHLAAQAYRQALHLADMQEEGLVDSQILAHLYCAIGLATLLENSTLKSPDPDMISEFTDFFAEAVRHQTMSGNISGSDFSGYCFYFGLALMYQGAHSIWRAIGSLQQSLLIDRVIYADAPARYPQVTAIQAAYRQAGSETREPFLAEEINLAEDDFAQFVLDADSDVSVVLTMRQAMAEIVIKETAEIQDLLFGSAEREMPRELDLLFPEEKFTWDHTTADEHAQSFLSIGFDDAGALFQAFGSEGEAIVDAILTDQVESLILKVPEHLQPTVRMMMEHKSEMLVAEGYRLLQLGKSEKAMICAEKAVEICTKVSPFAGLIPHPRALLLQVYLSIGRVDKARELIDKSEELSLGDEHLKSVVSFMKNLMAESSALLN